MLNKNSIKFLKSNKNKISLLKNLNLFKGSISSKSFGDKHSASGSDSEHQHDEHHDDHHDHHHKVVDFYEDYKMKEPRNIFNHINEDKFNISSLIEQLKEPINIKKNEHKTVEKNEGEKNLAEIENEYTTCCKPVEEK